jgi:hypothetical protein
MQPRAPHFIDIPERSAKPRRAGLTLARDLGLGFSAVEISGNIVPLSLQNKLDYIRMPKAAGLKVLFEIGEKYPKGGLDGPAAAAGRR